MKSITDNFKKYKKEVQKTYKPSAKAPAKKKKGELRQMRLEEVADTSAADFLAPQDPNQIECVNLDSDVAEEMPEKPKAKPKRKYQRRNKKSKAAKVEETKANMTGNDNPFDMPVEAMDYFIERNAVDGDNPNGAQYPRALPKKGRQKNSQNKKRRRRKNQEPEISIELYDQDLISVKFIGFFNENLKEMIKSRTNAFFDHDRKCWIANFQDYPIILEKVQEYVEKENIKFQEIPSFAIELMKGNNQFQGNNAFQAVYDYSKDAERDLSFESLPSSIKDNLYDFQKEGVEFALKKHGRFLLGDEMGVGKTIQAIAVSFIYQEDWPLLIICPSTIKYLWRDEILKWLPGLDGTEIQVLRTGSDKFRGSSSIFIMTYELAVKFSGMIAGINFKFAIVDEAHYLKNFRAKRSKILIPILARMRRVLLLSGTPMLAKPVELFNLLKILRPDIFYNFTDYAKRYCKPKETNYGMDYSGNDHTKELNCLLEKQIMIRRLKADVLSQLPPKRRQKIEVATDPAVVKKIKAILCKQFKNKGKEKKTIEERFMEMLAGEDKSSQNQQNKSTESGFILDEDEKCFLKAYHLSGAAKIRGILEFVETMIDNNTKFLLFAQHLEVLDKVEALVHKKKVDYIRIDGSVSTEVRHQSVQHFQEEPDCLVAILSITASSLGITMTAATNVIFAEVHWTPANLLQAEDRVHRIGQENSVNIYYLFGKDTMDDIIFPVLKQKSHVISETLDAKKSDYNLNIKTDEILEPEEKDNSSHEAPIELEKKQNRQKKSEVKKEVTVAAADPALKNSNEDKFQILPVDISDDESHYSYSKLTKAGASKKVPDKKKDKSSMAAATSKPQQKTEPINMEKNFDMSDTDLLDLVDEIVKKHNKENALSQKSEDRDVNKVLKPPSKDKEQEEERSDCDSGIDYFNYCQKSQAKSKSISQNNQGADPPEIMAQESNKSCTTDLIQFIDDNLDELHILSDLKEISETFKDNKKQQKRSSRVSKEKLISITPINHESLGAISKHQSTENPGKQNFKGPQKDPSTNTEDDIASLVIEEDDLESIITIVD
ncbi:unnamed protein product [Moneuplotes crassus]|uniref:Uncharacterized protein n=1 Tax=Euplotes crassus TaxID=5936 RepID=A0AAD2CXM7_EUPCR|nr:unnamed protein product [Moneuplotes crassus]